MEGIHTTGSNEGHQKSLGDFFWVAVRSRIVAGTDLEG
jgi:hypothetical protein